MKPANQQTSVTLLELLISIVIMGLIIIGFTSIDTFSRFQVISSERLSKIQNEAAFLLQDMHAKISRAIGNEKIYGANTTVYVFPVLTRKAISAYIDVNGNGERDNPLLGVDYWQGYQVMNSSADGPNRYRIRYCSKCTTLTCIICSTSWQNITNSHFIIFQTIKPNESGRLTQNYVDVNVTACWDPSQSPANGTCGTTRNPSVSMRTRIHLPSVSIF